MLAVLITLTPGRQNEFIDCQQAKVHIAVLPIMDGKTCWNSTLELLERAHQLREFTPECLKTQNTVITGHYSQHRISGWLLSISRRFYGHSSTGPCGCRNGIPLLCTTSSLSTITCLLTWMAWWELWPRRRLNGRKTYSLPWRLQGRSFPNIILHSLQGLVCSSFRHISLILCGSCDRLGSGTREWILILKTGLLILPNTRRPFWSMWRTNTALNINDCQSLNLKPYWTTIWSPPQWLLDLVNHLKIHIICAVMMKNTECRTLWPKRHPDEGIVPHTYWQPPGCIRIHLLNYHRTGGKLIPILIMITRILWRWIVHFGYRISPTGGGNKKKHSQSTPISPMWRATLSVSYLRVVEWRPVFPLGKM